MLLTRPTVDPAALEARTGWHLEPQGLCRDDRCVPLPDDARGTGDDGRLDVAVVAERLGMPLVADPEHGLWALGPEVTGRALTSAVLPDLTLLDLEGREVRLRSYLGRKLLLVAWASW